MNFTLRILQAQSTLVRCVSNDPLRMGMLTVVEDPSDQAVGPDIQGLGHPVLNAMSGQVLRNSLGKDRSPRERVKMYALGMSGSPGPLAISKPRMRRQAAGSGLLVQRPGPSDPGLDLGRREGSG